MPIHHATLLIHTRARGMHEITALVGREVKKSAIKSGIVTVFCRHTSASLMIMENADPSARADLEAWLDRLVPEHDPHFTHTLEGADDMPGHIKTALTRTSETIPVMDGALQLGTWQGVYLWEHRRLPHTREVLVTVMGE